MFIHSLISRGHLHLLLAVASTLVCEVLPLYEEHDEFHSCNVHQRLAVLIINCGRSNSHISQFDCTIGGGTLLHFECRERKGERDSSNVLQIKARDPINIITSWVHFSPVGAVSVRSPERGH